MSLAETVATDVRKRREALGITQAAVAANANVTVETIARLERVIRGRASANANPSLETMERIADALGVDVSDLVSPSKTRPKDDRLNVVLRGASGAVRRRVLLVAEALIRDEQSEARQAKAETKLKKPPKRR